MSEHLLKKYLQYDPETGFFRWLISPKYDIPVGSRAGSEFLDGYRYIKLKQVRYAEARLAWWFMKEVWPEADVDHRNLKPNDNRWKNIRKASRSGNLANRAGYKKDGLPKGVRRNRNRFTAGLTWKKKHVYLGSFGTPEEAHAAYCAKAAELHGEFFRP